jgi:hypothetical protein
VLFAGVQPYFDATAQQMLHGGPLNGAYPTTANPLADIPCWVTADIMVVFCIQVQGGPFAQSWIGNNANFVSNSNGVPPDERAFRPGSRRHHHQHHEHAAVPDRRTGRRGQRSTEVVETASQYCAAAGSHVARHCAQNHPRLSGRPRSGMRAGGGR